MGEYNASSIKIMSEQSLVDRFPWLAADALAREFKSPLEFVNRLLEACSILNYSKTDIEKMVQRYLAGNKNIPVALEFLDTYSDILKNKKQG